MRGAGLRRPAVAQDEAEALAHSGGKLVHDTAGSGSRAWLVDSATAKPGYAVYGPYAPLAAGRYVAAFRIKRIGAGSGTAATLDTCTGGGKRVTGSVSVAVSDLPEDAYRWVAVPFDHPGGDVETRLLWTGACALSLDMVSVWRIGD